MNEDELWASGHAQCLDCGRHWVAVWPLGADPLECPDCGKFHTTREPFSEEELMEAETAKAAMKTYQVAALDATGKSSVWHVSATDETEARELVKQAVFEETQEKPVVVLAVIPGGKK